MARLWNYHGCLGLANVLKDNIDICLLLNDNVSHKLYKNNDAGFKELEKYFLGVATYMNSKGYKVSVVNPFKIKSFGSTKLLRNKTDSYDAICNSRVLQVI